MKILHLDLETFSTTSIKAGAHRYAEDAEVLLVAWASNDDPVTVWETERLPHWRDALQAAIDDADRVVIHNSAFDRTVLRHVGVDVPVEKIIDTMVLALLHGLPGSLGQLCEALGVPQDKAKDKRGKRLINRFTKPQPKNMKVRRATSETHPDEWQEFIEYAALDVDAMRDVLGRLPRWNDTPSERELWRHDQNINDRGIAVDVELAQSALRAFDRAFGTLAARIERLTDGAVKSATQRNATVNYLRRMHFMELADLTKGTVESLLRGDLDPEVRELLEVRQQAAATSPAKYKALIDAVSSDGRLRGTIQFSGAARTARDAGRIFQPQNLPRTPDWFDEKVQDITVRAFKADADHLIWDNVSERCSMAVRGCLIAPRRRKLVIADLSNIEGRVLAWLAGEEWKIKAFRAYDNGEGHDLYKVTAGKILGKDPADVTKEERQLQGKTPELAGGYQGGVGAYRVMGGPVFEAMDDTAIQEIVWAWRKEHPKTKSLWYDIEAAAKGAIEKPGTVTEVRGGLLRFDVKADAFDRSWLRMRLPSGRFLCYVDAEIDEEGRITYSGVNQYTRKWQTLDTYGGKLTENAVQAIARDVFMTGMRRAEEHDYPVVLRVHDELVCEVPDHAGYTAEVLAGLMSTNPGWAIGLPLSAAGFETRRYRKE
jgi:DNA polymerase